MMVTRQFYLGKKIRDDLDMKVQMYSKVRKGEVVSARIPMATARSIVLTQMR